MSEPAAPGIGLGASSSPDRDRAATPRPAVGDGQTDQTGQAAPTSVGRGSVAQRARAWLAGLVSWIACHAPERLAIRLADIAGSVWYRTSAERRDQAHRNLSRVVGYLAERGLGGERVRAAATDPRELDRLVRSSFRHAVRYYLEVARTPSVTPAFVRERLLIETPDVVDEAFATRGPLIFVGLHFGAIELPAIFFVQRTGSTATVPMETIADPELQRYFVRTRGKVGLHIVGLREARRELTAALRRGEPVGLVGDRDLTGGGLEIEFFGAPARLPIGPALLAIESGAPTYVVAVRRGGVGRYRGRLRRVEVASEGSRRERLRVTLQRLARAFEEEIAEAPDQWWAVFFPIWDAADGTTVPGSTAADGAPTAALPTAGAR